MTGEVRARSSTYFTEVKRRRRRLRLDISKAKIAAVLRGEEGGGLDPTKLFISSFRLSGVQWVGSRNL